MHINCAVSTAGLAVACAVLWAAANELLIQPKEYTCFNLALERIRCSCRRISVLQRQGPWQFAAPAVACCTGMLAMNRSRLVRRHYAKQDSGASKSRAHHCSNIAQSCTFLSCGREDPRVTVRLGTPISAYGQESRNRAARQRIPHRAYTDSDGVEHHQVGCPPVPPSTAAVQVQVHVWTMCERCAAPANGLMHRGWSFRTCKDARRLLCSCRLCGRVVTRWLLNAMVCRSSSMQRDPAAAWRWSTPPCIRCLPLLIVARGWLCRSSAVSVAGAMWLADTLHLSCRGACSD